MTPEHRAKALREADWQQGSVCCEADVPALLLAPAHPRLSCQPGDWWVVVTQTCDVLQGDLEKEPEVELLRLSHQRPEVHSSLGWTQHPRFIQLEQSLPGQKLYACVHDRVWVPRERLDSLRPDAARKLAHQDIRMLAKWLASRYLRVAYPDTFNDRLRPIRNDLAKFWKGNRGRLRAVFCEFGSTEELPVGEAYEVEFVLVHPRAMPADEATKLKKSFEDLFESCEGVEVSAKVMADIDFSLAHLDRYSRWDLDHLSLANPEQHPLPPAGIDCE